MNIESDDLSLTDLPGELYYDADESLPSNTVHVECSVCKEELEVKLTIINDSQGDGPYLTYFTTIDDYTINWTGHGYCRELLDFESQLVQTELEATILEAGFKLIQNEY